MRATTLAAAGLSYLSIASAAGLLPVRELETRSGNVAFDASCDKAPPAGDWKGFNSMKDVLNQAMADVNTLAVRARNIDSNSLPFTHYFDKSVPSQVNNFKKMMQGISESDKLFSIIFDCSNPANTCKPGTQAVTDSRKGSATDQKTIHICRDFWTDPSSSYLLFQAGKGAKPAKPFKDNTATGWCNLKADTNGFSTAGTVLLHELTHLDALGTYVGLAKDPQGTGSGTSDNQNNIPGARKFLLGARTYLTWWLKNKKELAPDENAESYAATATELYFTQICSWTETHEIPPGDSLTMPRRSSRPVCSNYNTPSATAKKLEKALNERGGFNCCTDGSGGCVNIAVADKMAVDLCSTSKEIKCIDCAAAANYVAGFQQSCTKGGKVGAKQDVNEAKGVSIQL